MPAGSSLICKWCKRPIDFDEEVDEWIHSNGEFECSDGRRFAEPPGTVTGSRILKWGIVAAVVLTVAVASFITFSNMMSDHQEMDDAVRRSCLSLARIDPSDEYRREDC